ncbi:MAG: heat-inducible transcriptional repressor HrcA [Pseudomonadota bacterium]
MAANEPQLSERGLALLKALVERHIRDGQPVGSRALSRESGLDVSPATIRNIMADLEDLGLVRAPHTSAGRIPTAQGYRLFVDSMLTVQPLEEQELHSLSSYLDPDATLPELYNSASSLLSSITSMAGVVVLPRREQASFRHIEFVPLSEGRLLVIWVVNEREVQNRIIHTSGGYSESDLEEAATYLNRHFSGRDLADIRASIIREMREARDSANRLMLNAMEMAEKAFAAEPEKEGGDYVIEGQLNLMDYEEMADTEKLRQLFQAFAGKRDILQLLDQATVADGVQIFIGEESGYEVFEDMSVVASPYAADGRTLGVLGVIGPTRMAYDRVIPVVDITAKLLGAALNRQN